MKPKCKFLNGIIAGGRCSLLMVQNPDCEKCVVDASVEDYTWGSIKQGGSNHYKSKDVEPIDLYRSGGLLRDFTIGNVIKYVYRNRTSLNKPINTDDIKKAIHYCEMLIVLKET